MDQETYDALLADIKAGKVVNYNGRSAHSIDQLDFIVRAEKKGTGGIVPSVVTISREEMERQVSEQTTALRAHLDSAAEERDAAVADAARLQIEVNDLKAHVEKLLAAADGAGSTPTQATSDK